MSIWRALESVAEPKVNVLCHATVGNQLGVIKSVSNVLEDGETDIVHKDGQVIIIMFWASWCDYCKKEMGKAQKMVAKNKERWNEKVRIIGLGIDVERSKQIAFIKAKKLTAFEHYNVKNSKSKAI